MPLPTPNKGEDKDKFTERCMSELASEYEDTAQRYAICMDCWSKKFSEMMSKMFYEKRLQHEAKFSFSMMELNFAGEKISIDYDDTLSTDRGKTLARQLVAKGVNLYIITRRRESDMNPVYAAAREVGVKRENVHYTNGKMKWETIKRLGITKHIDNNPDELRLIREKLPNVKVEKFLEQG